MELRTEWNSLGPVQLKSADEPVCRRLLKAAPVGFAGHKTILHASTRGGQLLPPKLQRRGLVFKGKMGYYGACMMGYYD